MTTQERAIQGLDKRPFESKKFWALLVGLVLMAAIGVVALIKSADSGLVGVILSQILLATGGYVWSTNWNERGVRMASVVQRTEPPK